MTGSIAHLASRALIGLVGPDWKSFLQGLVTQDVETLAVGELRYGALLTPQGRLINDLFVWGDDAGGVLDVTANAREALIAKLKMYRLRAKVEIAPLNNQMFAAWGDAPADIPGGWRADPRLPALGLRGAAETIANALPEAAYDAHRLALGVPDPAKDGVESDYPIEANLDLLHGIDFKKGCFVGQETTSRMHRRGVVKTRMAPIAFDGPPPPFGAQILAGERRAGEVRGGIDGRAMAVLRIDRTGAEPLTADGRPLALDLPLWLAGLFQPAAEEPPQS
jgi:folate-binding protein YgfZ